MIIINAVGHDRPGMVAAISQKLAEAGCNIEDATMTRLCGQFAMILVVLPPRGLSTQSLAESLSSLQESHGLLVQCNAIEDDQIPKSQPDERYILSVYGTDRTGLVSSVAGVLSELGVNITDLQTRITTSHSVYIMIFELELPAELDSQALDEKLKVVTGELDVEYSLRQLEEDTL